MQIQGPCHLATDLDISKLPWRKSTRSGPSSDDCVEVAPVPAEHGGGVLIRHSKHPHGATIWYSDSEWAAFVAGARAGEFDTMI